jgi:predicted SnoaL-like aldol condensation-catalyzing enzyme
MRAQAAGDRVALHTHQTWPGGDEYGTMDCFRIEVDGKLVEHQDAIPAVPPQTTCGNPMG